MIKNSEHLGSLKLVQLNKCTGEHQGITCGCGHFYRNCGPFADFYTLSSCELPVPTLAQTFKKIIKVIAQMIEKEGLFAAAILAEVRSFKILFFLACAAATLLW